MSYSFPDNLIAARSMRSNYRVLGVGRGMSAVRPQAPVKYVGGSAEGKRIFSAEWMRRGGLIMSVARGRSENRENCKSSCPNVDVISKLFSVHQ